MSIKAVDMRHCGIIVTAVLLALGAWNTHDTRVSAHDGHAVLYRVNAGGPALTATPNWTVDTKSTPSPYTNASATGNRTYSTSAAIDISHASIPAGTPAALFQTERYDTSGGAQMQWSFPVTPGSYEVRLYFAEIFFTSPGARVFNVAIEGVPVLTNYDIVADVGAFKGVMKSFTVTADMTLDVVFSHGIENPKISAIEILDANTSPGEIGVVPASLDFSAVLVGQSSQQTVQVKNLGGSGDPSLQVFATTITGIDAHLFADNFTDGVAVTLAPGQSTTLTVSFAPDSSGSKSAALEISHSGLNSPSVVPLAGTGTIVLQGAWQSRAPSGMARQEVAYVHLNGKFYLAGGSTAHEVYDASSDSWASLMPLPVNVDHIQAVTLGGRIYYIGGLLGWPQPASSAVYIYDPATNSFTTGAPMSRPRGAGGVAVYDGKIFYAGGLAGGTAVGWFDVYDPVANTWTALTDMPVARDHFHAAVVGSRFYVTGGRATSINATIGSTIAYDFGSGTWQTSGLAPIPTQRGGFAAAVLGTEILIIGGEGGGATFSTVEAYDTATNTWRMLAPMPTARHGIQAAECNGGVYVAAGGTTQGGGSPTNAHEVFFLGSATTCGTAPPPAGSLYRVNAGGAVISATPNWSADTSSSPSPYSNVSAAKSKTFSTSSPVTMGHPSVLAGTPMSLFQTERYDTSSGVEMLWSFPVTPGAYEVRLYFAELYFTNPGSRVFNVAIEGSPVLNNYDIVADVGSFTAVVKSFTVTADSTLDIAFTRIVENPKISAIEILDATPKPNELGASTSALDFGAVLVGQSGNLALHVRNLGGPGDPSIGVSSTTITGADAAQFADDFPDGSTVTLAPGETRTINVGFTPASTGTKTSTLEIAHSGVNNPVTVTLSGSGTTSTTPPGTWSTLAPSGISRHEISYVQYNGKFYLSGDRGRLEHEVYDPVTNSWSFAAPLPSEFHHGQAVDLNGLIYHLGGLVGPYPDHVTPDVNIYNPATNTWSKGTPMPAGRARGGGGTAIYNGKLYVAGGLQDEPSGTGHDGVSVSLFDQYDPVSGVWTPLPNMPRARDHFHAAVVGNKLYALAGRKGGDSGFFNAVIAPVDVYDFTTATWSTLPESSNIPTPRAGVGVAVLGSEIIVIGGEGNGSAYNAVEAFNTLTGTWRTLASMPTARHGIQAAVCNGGIYIVDGGLKQGGGSLTNIHQVFFLGTPTGCGAAPPPSPVGFGKSTLAGTSGLHNPTSIQFGPDGRLYVAEQHGLIRIYTVTRSAANSYAVTSTQVVNSIQSVPNHNDDGQPNPSINTRLITGLLVVGTASNPVMYVAHSDPRIGGGSSGADLNLDTNSSMISRLTWTGSTWQKLDLVRGLPRSEENHAANGMQLDPATNTLYVAMGGNTNKGAPSNNFAYLPEFALSAAILSINLTAIGNTTYDLPTLDDEDRPGNPDFNDPFGGNNGKNQARLVPGGPVQVHAPGFRNPYDLVITEAGRLYSIDNGGNAGWGNIPVNSGPQGVCTNDPSEPGTTDPDSLHFITGPGYYGGHPNPTRGNMANTFNASNPQAPVSVANPVECEYRKPGPASGALATFPTSTNGLAEYKTNSFGGSMRGNLLAAGWNGNVYRVELNSAGNAATNVSTLFSSVGKMALDIVALGASDPFPGTIWVGVYGSDTIVAFEPNDYDSAPPPCTGAYDWNLDEDGDGYKNADEIDNGTNPCSAADVPPDWDGDFISDLNDPDDDNDGIPDVQDRFALDPLNGTGTRLPVEYFWENDGTNPGGILNLGFTGLMINGVSNYGTLYDPDRMTAGGAAGVVTVDQVSEGDAYGSLNNQEYGFQFGLWANPADTGTFFVHTRILAPFAGLTPQNGQSMGLFIGAGDQDNYAKIVVSGTGGGSIAFLREVGGTVDAETSTPLALPGPNYVDLYLRVDPVAATVQPFYSVTTEGATGPQVMLAAPQAVPGSWFTNPFAGLAVGIISTSRGPGPEFPATWAFIRALPATAAPTLAVIPGALDFGSVPLGHTHALGLELTNLGGADTADLVISGTTISGGAASQFSDDFNDAAGVRLRPGEGTAIAVTFAPTSTGNKTAALTISHSIGSPFVVQLAGAGVTSGAPVLGASPTSAAFGNVTVGETAAVALQLTNLGATSLVVNGTTITGTDASQFTDDFNDGSGVTLAPSASMTVMVTFGPTFGGSKSATLAIAHTGDNTPVQVALSGTGVSPPPLTLEVSPGSLGFAGVTVGQSSALALQLTNLGASNLVVSGTTITGTDASQFTDNLNDAAGVTLAPGATTSVTVTFAPSSSGNKSATLAIAHSGENTPVQVALSGSGTSGVALYRVNAGGPAITSTPNWTIDTNKSPSAYLASSGSKTFTTSTAIDTSHPSLPAGTPASLLQSERYDPAGGAEMLWSFPVTPGSYEVRLYFAEVYYTSQGQRTFNVAIEGNIVLQNYDIVADVGAFRGVMKSFVVTTDTSLDILFGHVIENPKISAIEILPATPPEG